MRKTSRLFVIIAVLGMCFMFLYPTVRWYFLTDKKDSSLAFGSREKIRDYAINMAQDDVNELIDAAKAGSTDSVDEQKYSAVIKKAKQNRKKMNKSMPESWTAIDLVASFPAGSEQQVRDELRPLLEDYYRESILKTKSHQAGAVKLGLDLSGGMSLIIKADLDSITAVKKSESVADDGKSKESKDDKAKTVDDKKNIDVAQAKKDAMSLAIETLRGRIDKFGLSEPIIRQQGEDRIYVELPGATDTDQINSIIMGRGLLAFHIVDNEATKTFRSYYAANPGKTFDANYNLLDPSIIPEDTMLLGVYKKDAYGVDERNEDEPFLVIKKKPGLEGRYLTEVRTVTDPTTGEPLVLFSLDSEGAEIFRKLTRENTGKRLAIVSDNKVKSAPVINTEIGASGSISGFSAKEAENLKTVLRSAWLNVPLSLESQQSVGATMGKQAIDQGVMALFWGLIAVLVFMLVYYLEAGINACIAQVLNLYIMFSVLSAFNMTLSLPSIAGMILTIGMAVDANVVIFERIKEELKLGKSRAAAIEAGFDQAFWAIMDSNVTTFIAAVFLSVLGSGPIKGFAYSLSIGVVSSVFTALFVSRLIFDFGTQTLGLKKIRMSWRKYN
ncbi:MAG: protein translocase subunit SecD [Treponema sp.]|nr:MAG: protein translocase subunit SecD [Treponema sp.]